MNRIILLCFFLIAHCIATDSFCQRQRAKDFAEAKTTYLTPEPSRYNGNISIPFRQIKVIDYRFDTSKVGYIVRKRRHECASFQGGVETTLSDFLNQYFASNLDPASSQTLLIVLKKLWLQYGATNYMLKEKDLPIGHITNEIMRNSVCLAEIEVFAGNNETYQAVTKINHHFHDEYSIARSDFRLLLLPFDSLVNKINTMNVPQVIASKNKYSIEEIHTAYKKRFDWPVLTQNLSRGIYLSFDDFKNNKASYPDFVVKTSRLSSDVMSSKDRSAQIIIDYWGFFDGKDLYVKPGLLPFKAIRKGNTFDLLGALSGDVSASSSYTTTQYGTFALNSAVPYIPAKPLQVDMETGKVY